MGSPSREGREVASHPVRCVIVIPTFNERENITDLLRTLRSTIPDAHVFVIDDLSPDGTGAAAEAVANELGHISVVHRSGKPGLGAAYRHGFGLAFEYDGAQLIDGTGIRTGHGVAPQGRWWNSREAVE